MGRWAQATRRGSAPPLQSLTLLSVQYISGTQVRLNFDKPPAVVQGSFAANGAFTVAALNTSTVFSVSGNSVTVGMSGVPAIGNAYALNSQPPWLKNSAVFPLAGTVT